MQKIFKAFAVGIVAFSIILALIVGTRMDAFTMAMLGGAFIGLLIAVPTTLTATMLVTRQHAPRERAPYYSSPLPPSPPQYWQMPGQQAVLPQPTPMMQQPAYSPQLTNPNIAWPAAPRRRFYVIGEAGEVEELDAPVEAEAGFRVLAPQPQMI